MTRLTETIETTLPIEATFAYLSDFANSQEWDPGVATAERVGNEPVRVGSRYRLGVRVGNRIRPMEYKVVDFVSPRRVVLVGSGSGVSAVDTIEFARTPTGTRVVYTADITLRGAMRLVQPFIGGTFAKIALDAAGGIQHQLDARASETASDRPGESMSSDPAWEA